MRPLAAVGLLAVAAACKSSPEGPVCGLHSASAPVTLKGKDGDHTLSVGARLVATDRLSAKKWALLECFGGALKVLKRDELEVGELRESRVDSFTLPTWALQGGALVKVDGTHRPIAARFSDNRFTPEAALIDNTELTSADYFKAFFTPNGMANLQAAPAVDGPRKLPPPPSRPKVPFIHGGELGEGGAVLKVTDDVVFAETDDLATAALLEDHSYQLGRTVRLVLPDGAEATLSLPGGGHPLELEGPMDLRLK